MATTRFNNNILEAARRLHDLRTDPTSSGDAGKRYTSAILSGYQNRAIRELISEMYQKVGSRISDIMPEIVKEAAVSLSASFAAPSDSWIPLSLHTSTVPFTLINDSRSISQLRTGQDALRVPSATDPYFFQVGSNIVCLGLAAGSATLRYVVQPADITPSLVTDVTSKCDYYMDGMVVGIIGTISTAVGGPKTYDITDFGTMTFATTDVGKVILFFSGGNVYWEYISTRVDSNTVTLSGGNAPSSAAVYCCMIVPALNSNDILLAKPWDSEIINKMVAYGIADAKSAIAVG